MATITEIVIDLLEAMNTPGRVDDFLDALTSDATWTIPGNWPRISGVLTRPDLDTFARIIMPAGFPGGADLTFHHVGEAGETVFAELTVTARTSKDRAYENHYCFVVDVRDGKIAAIREYMDTLYADEVLHQ